MVELFPNKIKQLELFGKYLKLLIELDMISIVEAQRMWYAFELNKDRLAI